MSKRTKGDGTNSVLASVRNQRVSAIWSPSDRKNILVQVNISAIAETSAITFKLLESANGTEFNEVGSQSEVTITSIVCDSSTDIANATEIFTSTSHARETGDPFIYLKGSTIVGGLTDGATYYFIWVSANTFKLATSYENAQAGTAVAISDDGAGNQTFWDARYEIRMESSDSSDAAQLPVHEFVAVGVSTGSSDTVTVSDVFS